MKSNFATLYLIRHGESESNVAVDGKIDSIKPSDELATKLTKRGVAQAEELAKRFKNIHVDAIFSSDLTRAHQTASAIALQKKLAVTTSKLIRERVYGKTYNALLYSEQHRLSHEAQEELKKLDRIQQMRVKRFPDMESREEVVSRTLTFLREIAVAYGGKTVIVVAHGDLMRSLLAHLGYAMMHELPIGAVNNTGYLKFETDGIDFLLRDAHEVYMTDRMKKEMAS